MDDEIIHYRSENATFSERKKELEKAKSYNEQIIIHFIMIYFPNAKYDKTSINKNKSALINNWMKKITETFLKANDAIIPSKLGIDIDHKYIEKVRTILIKKHKYSSMKQFEWRKIKLMFQALYANWDKLVADSKIKGVTPNNVDYENIFKELDKIIN
jgi:hypothetical protein